MKTLFIIEEVFKAELMSWLRTNTINESNLPDQFTSIGDITARLDKMQRCSSMSISTSVPGIVPLELNDDVILYGNSYRVCSKCFIVKEGTLKYRLR